MNCTPFTLTVRGRLVTFERPAVMGILNITPDSFYDGGRHNTPDAMLDHARWLLSEGADIIDIGAASSRPGAILPPPEDEAKLLSEAIKLIRSELPDAILSVDTCYSLPARRAIEAGADIVNDISGGLFDPEMFPTVAALQVPYILMHNRALPTEMQQHTGYDDISTPFIGSASKTCGLTPDSASPKPLRKTTNYSTVSTNSPHSSVSPCSPP